jgi:nicotinamidase-related amidase
MSAVAPAAAASDTKAAEEKKASAAAVSAPAAAAAATAAATAPTALAADDKLPRNTALLVIDVQKGFDLVEHWGGGRNNAKCEDNIHTVLEAWRARGMPVVHVQHTSLESDCPLRPNQVPYHRARVRAKECRIGSQFLDPL